ncbi:hypothetical protein CROQUDRAFT_714492 [Cronartium quercuum f. sp. fusiforme G11]|uniref:Uncharacterized protein n=1 Tax=Cronartium quercuum f. sp. fusiforme G11 TaxID=708437 RepID=A0A9P6TE91_9BASI|nr:hypothetical protein CROQUDRAFT_714492 [Cronartium quercuum f. sp. fusiforme G11]
MIKPQNGWSLIAVSELVNTLPPHIDPYLYLLETIDTVGWPKPQKIFLGILIAFACIYFGIVLTCLFIIWLCLKGGKSKSKHRWLYRKLTIPVRDRSLQEQKIRKGYNYFLIYCSLTLIILLYDVFVGIFLFYQSENLTDKTLRGIGGIIGLGGGALVAPSMLFQVLRVINQVDDDQDQSIVMNHFRVKNNNDNSRSKKISTTSNNTFQSSFII